MELQKELISFPLDGPERDKKCCGKCGDECENNPYPVKHRLIYPESHYPLEEDDYDDW